MALKALMAAGALLPLSFCNPQPPITAPPPASLCAIGPPPLSTADALTPAMQRWLLVVLKTGAPLCGWQPPKH